MNTLQFNGLIEDIVKQSWKSTVWNLGWQDISIFICDKYDLGGTSRMISGVVPLKDPVCGTWNDTCALCSIKRGSDPCRSLPCYKLSNKYVDWRQM